MCQSNRPINSIWFSFGYLAVGVLLVLSGPRFCAAQTDNLSSVGRHRVEIRSTADGSLQPLWVRVPPALPYKATRHPLLVLLHTWSYDLDQDFPAVEAEAAARGWLFVQPNFRGRNDRPEACGSSLAQQDILDAVEWVKGHYPVDETRVYLLGFSGGAYMTMLMVSRHPEPWAAASAWGGISDLTQWYREHRGDDYGRMLRACLGGDPLGSAKSAAEASARSPLTYLSASLRVPLDLAAGIGDSDVAPQHTLRAFRSLAPSALSDKELRRALAKPRGSAVQQDAVFGRGVFFRRVAGQSRVTIFDGTHELIPWAAMIWLAQHQRPPH